MKKRFGLYVASVTAGLVIGLFTAPLAKSEPITKRVTARQCKSYAEIQNVVTNNRVSVAKAFVVCQTKMREHWMNTPMTCAELGSTMCRVRACESGKRRNGKPIIGTFDYTAENPSSAALTNGLIPHGEERKVTRARCMPLRAFRTNAHCAMSAGAGIQVGKRRKAVGDNENN